MDLVQKTPPAVEPVVLADVKKHANITITEDDDYLTNILIPAARVFVEDYTKRKLINQTWTLYLDNFHSQRLYIPSYPVSLVNSIKTYSTSNVLSTIDPANYQLINNTVLFNDDYSNYFSNTRYVSGTAVEFVVGYGATGASVPIPMRLAIYQLVAHWYENREAVFDPMLAATNPANENVRYRVSALLSPYRIIPI